MTYILVIYHAFLELFACFGFLPTVKKSELLSVKLFQMKNVRIPLNFSKSNPSFIYVLHFDPKRVEHVSCVLLIDLEETKLQCITLKNLVVKCFNQSFR